MARPRLAKWIDIHPWHPNKCKCNLKLDDDLPIATKQWDPDIPMVSFTPNWAGNAAEPTCEPETCTREGPTFKWSITKIKGNPTLSDDTKEVATVRGEGDFMICLHVEMKCSMVVFQDEDGGSITRVTDCTPLDVCDHIRLKKSI
jgi:hypothetical protein